MKGKESLYAGAWSGGFGGEGDEVKEFVEQGADPGLVLARGQDGVQLAADDRCPLKGAGSAVAEVADVHNVEPGFGLRCGPSQQFLQRWRQSDATSQRTRG